MKTESMGQEIYNLAKKLYPICRSITGNGVRETLRILQDHIPLEIKSVPTGTKVFDWKIPQEWNIIDAYIKNSHGKKVVDFKQSNLHVLNYSIPVHTTMTLKELKKKLYSLPDYPDWIPYLTTYYKKQWGFCLAHNQLKRLEEDTYEIFIDSSLQDGELNYGELYIKGETKEEVLFTCYLCHPSLCHDSLSGVSLLTRLAKTVYKRNKNKYSYRFLFIPETIGAITWISLNQNKLPFIKHGLLATCVGDAGNLTYKKSRNGNATIDKIVEKVLKDSQDPYSIIDFDPCGSDERQFCSPGINLPLGSLMRTPYACYKEYHTSADNLNFIKTQSLEDSYNKYLQTIFILEHNETYLNLNPMCEPQLGKYGLYRLLGGKKDDGVNLFALLWTLNLSDGDNSLLDIAIRSNISFNQIKKAADSLVRCNLFMKKTIPLLKPSKGNHDTYIKEKI